MRKLRFRYEMKLRLSDDVVRHSFSLRCLPKNTGYQRIEELFLEIDPDTAVTKTCDAFGNDVCFGYIEEPHRRFGFKVTGEAITDSENVDMGPLNPLYKFSTPQTTLLKGTEPYLAAALGLHDPVQKALAMCERLYRRFAYIPNTTYTTTTAQQALDQGRGVCQDYAHIMIALCRQSDIPARYVAGFMIGEGATHAWLDIYAKGQWIGIDPTHNRMVDDRYIKISEGRDAGDCIIDKGVFFGTPLEQEQQVALKVAELPLK